MVLPGFHTVQQGDRRFFRQSLASITGDGPGNCDDSELSPLPLALALGTIVSKVARILSLTFLTTQELVPRSFRLPRRLGPSVSLLITGLVMFAPSEAYSQSPDSIPPDSARILGGLTVRVARPALTVGGASAVVVDLDSLGSIPSPSMAEVLRSMPLIQMRQNSRGEIQPSLRGSEDRQIAILMDGVPLTIGWDHRTDMSIIPLTAARSVTLVRGLSSVLHGPNTLGGVVEVDVARGSARVEALDPLTAGFSLDETGATNVSVTGGHLISGRDHQWVLRGGGGFSDRRGYPIAGETLEDASLDTQFLSADALRLNSDQRRVDGFFSARYRDDAGAWTSIAASGFDVERGVPPEAHQEKPRLWRYPEQRRMIAAVTGGTGQRVTKWGEGEVEASIGFDVGSTRIQQFRTAAYKFVEETEDADDRVITARMLGEHTLGTEVDLRASGTFAEVSHDELLNEFGSGSSEFSYQQRLWSVGVETEWRPSASGVTTLTLGASYDGANTPKSADKPPVDVMSDFGLRMGLSSLVAEGVLVHGGVSRRSRFPSLRELYSGALGRFEPNPYLKPETLFGAETGFTVTGSGGEMQLVGFHQRLTDGIVRRSFIDLGNPRFQRVNQDEVRSSGMELLLVGVMGGATLTGDLTVQSVDGFEADGSTVELEYEPAIVGKFGFDVPIPTALRFGGEARYVGAQKCENPEVGGLQPLGSSTSFDLSLRRIFSFGGVGFLSRLDTSAAVKNVTDRAIFDQCGLPQTGRFVQIQFRIW